MCFFMHVFCIVLCVLCTFTILYCFGVINDDDDYGARCNGSRICQSSLCKAFDVINCAMNMQRQTQLALTSKIRMAIEYL